MNNSAMIKIYGYSIKGLDTLQSVFALVLRGWLAYVFFLSGLTKIRSWETTLMLFEYEYNVPLISHVLAAWMATITELALPPLLALGILTRPMAIVLFIFNIVAMISYPDISPAGTKEHMMWGIMIAVLIFYGAGKVSVDYWVSRKFK